MNHRLPVYGRKIQPFYCGIVNLKLNQTIRQSVLLPYGSPSLDRNALLAPSSNEVMNQRSSLSNLQEEKLFVEKYVRYRKH